MDVLSILLLGVAGIFGGILAGLIGIGGGIIYIFLLEIFIKQYNIPADLYSAFIVANSIVGVFFATLSSSLSLIRYKQFYSRLVLLVSLGSIPTALLILYFFVNTSSFSPTLFNTLLMVVLFFMIYKTAEKLLKDRKAAKDQVPAKNKANESVPWLMSGGAAGGGIAALTGLGGGVVMVPILHSILNMDMKKARSVSLGVIVLTSLIMSILNATKKVQLEVHHIGLIIPAVTLPIVIGVTIGGPIGIRISQNMPSRTVSIIYIIFLGLFTIKKGIEWLN